ncbi:Mitogen-activated protein kinase adapter protein MST50, partial [Cryomyces antarcticus]
PPNSAGATSSTRRDRERERERGGGERGMDNTVEIFKSFRVSVEDPCYKVLPVALKKYNITADWREYALYIVHGDQERCLGLQERPLTLFKQLDREGRKPMFMLRKHAPPAEGHSNTIAGGGVGMMATG